MIIVLLFNKIRDHLTQCSGVGILGAFRKKVWKRQNADSVKA